MRCDGQQVAWRQQAWYSTEQRLQPTALKVIYAAVHKPACSLFKGIFSLRRRFQWPWPAFQELKHSTLGRPRWFHSSNPGVAAGQLCSLRMQWILGAMLHIPSQSSSSGFWSYSQFPVAAALDSTRSIRLPGGCENDRDPAFEKLNTSYKLRYFQLSWPTATQGFAEWGFIIQILPSPLASSVHLQCNGYLARCIRCHVNHHLAVFAPILAHLKNPLVTLSHIQNK